VHEVDENNIQEGLENTGVEAMFHLIMGLVIKNNDDDDLANHKKRMGTNSKKRTRKML